ncbi:MAG: hypothetical protein ABIH40_05310 [Candidatus Omnitrophota bacterium]
MSNRLKIKRSAVSSLVIFFISVGYLLSFYNYGINLHDEGILLNGALRLLHGDVIGRDFFNYPHIAGIQALYAFLFKLFGIKLDVVRLFAVFLTAVTVALGYLVSKKIMPDAFAVIVAALLLVAPGPYYARFFAFFTFLYLLIISKYLERMSSFWLLTAAAVTGISFGFRIDSGLIAAATTGIVIAIRNIYYAQSGFIKEKDRPVKKPIKELLLFYSAVSIFAAPTVIYFILPAVKNNLVSFSRSSLSNFLYYAALPFATLVPAVNPSNLEAIERIRAVFEKSLFYLPMFLYAITFLSIIRRFILKKIRQTDLCLILFMTYGVLAYYRVIYRPDFEHLLNSFSAVYVIGCYFLFRIWNKSKVLTSILILIIPITLIADIAFCHGFQLGSVGILRDKHVLLDLPRARIYCPPYDAEVIKETVDYIEANTNPTDKIFALPFNPILYFLCGRRNATRYDILLFPAVPNQTIQQKVLKELKESQPGYIIFQDYPDDGREEHKFSHYAKLISDYILSNYSREIKIGPLDVLSRMRK